MRPFGTSDRARLTRWRADLLKLRKSRGLLILIALTTVVPEVIMFALLASLHAANPGKHGAAGGVVNFGHGLWLLSALGGIAAIITGAKAGADDTSAGVFRELVATGSPRALLFAIRIPSGLALLAPFVAGGLLIAAVAARLLHGGLVEPSARLLLLSGVWAFSSISFWYLLSLGVASLIGSRGYTIGLLLGFRLAISQVVSAIGALGGFRGSVPSRGLEHFLPQAVADQVREGPVLHQSAALAALVVAAWLVTGLVAGAWKTTTRDA